MRVKDESLTIRRETKGEKDEDMSTIIALRAVRVAAPVPFILTPQAYRPGTG